MSGKDQKRYKPKPYRITFEEGHEFEDVEVHARRISVDDLMGLMEVADLAQEVADGSAVVLTEAHKKAVLAVTAAMASVITWWNVDGDDGPVAPDEAGVRAQELSLVMAIFGAYFDRVASVAPPLPKGSPAGPEQEELGSIPTETLPPSPGS